MTRDLFIGQITHWDSYKPLLWEALENTQGSVIELGLGVGSTELLHNYCQENERKLFSYETSSEFFHEYDHFNTENHRVEYVGHNWQILYDQQCGKEIGVLFSDEAPGEYRKYNISMFCNTAKVIVVHDSEPDNDHGYKLSLIRPLFKYALDFHFPGASATAFSNFVDVHKWVL